MLNLQTRSAQYSPAEEDLLGDGVLRDEGPPALTELEDVDPTA